LAGSSVPPSTLVEEREAASLVPNLTFLEDMEADS
jgi:hypothetical protein